MYGQEEWGLQKCINTAIERNLSIKNIDLTLQGAEIDIKQAQHTRYPSLNGSVGMNLNFGRSIDPTTNSFVNNTFFSNNYSINSGVLLYNGGRINNTIKQAILSSQSAGYTKEQVERDIALNVATLYLNVLLANENIDIAQNNLDATKNQLDQMDRLIKSGARAEIERYNLEAQLANNEQALISANNNFTIAMLQMKQALLIEDNENFVVETVPGEIPITTDPDIITIEELYQAALMNQKSIRAAELNVQASEMGEKIAASQYLPSVSLGGSLGTNYSNQSLVVVGQESGFQDVDIILQGQQLTVGFPFSNPIFDDKPYADQISENLSYGFGMNISIPIYNNYGPKGNVERAKISTKSNLIQLEQEKQTLMINVQQALADARANKSTYLAAQKSKKAQELAYENAKKRYDVEAIGVFELTNTKALYDNALISELLAKYDYIFRTKVLDFYLGKPIILN